jgi:hypothetical protein
MLAFEPKRYFEIEERSRAAPQVDFSTPPTAPTG